MHVTRVTVRAVTLLLLTVMLAVRFLHITCTNDDCYHTNSVVVTKLSHALLVSLTQKLKQHTQMPATVVQTLEKKGLLALLQDPVVSKLMTQATTFLTVHCQRSAGAKTPTAPLLKPLVFLTLSV
jgi:hypothetical protein